MTLSPQECQTQGCVGTADLTLVVENVIFPLCDHVMIKIVRPVMTAYDLCMFFHIVW